MMVLAWPSARVVSEATPKKYEALPIGQTRLIAIIVPRISPSAARKRRLCC